MSRQTAEQIYRGLLRGPLATKASSASNQWAGVSTVLSGTATITVSTTNVKSNSVILHGQRSQANSSVALEVKSIVDSSYFSFGTLNGANTIQNIDMHWILLRTD